MLKHKKGSFITESDRSNFHNNTSSIPSLELPTTIELIVKGERYYLQKDNPLFPVIYPLIQNLPMVAIENRTVLSIALPLNLNKTGLELFFQWLTLPNPPMSDLVTFYQLISACLFFNTKDALQRVIIRGIEPIIDRASSIEIIELYYPYVYNESYGELFNHLVKTAIALASSNLFYVIYNMKEAFLNLPENPLEDIIEQHFQSVLFNEGIDHSLVMGILMKKRGISDVFELLENERKKSIAKFEKMLGDGVEPSLEWTITADLGGNVYKESEEFFIDSVKVMMMSYYDIKSDVYSVALQILSIKEEDADITQKHFSKDESGQSANSTVNKGQSSDSSQFIISLLSICEIPQISSRSKINFNCFFSNSKGKVLISRIENFSKRFSDINAKSEVSFTLKVFLSISYNFSSILTHICKNFYQYHSLYSVGIVPKNVLNVILRNEEMSIQSEDEVLIAVMNWLSYRNNQSAEMLLEVVKNINWPLVSLESIFDFLHSQGKVFICNNELQELIANEFTSRFKEENDIEENTVFIEANGRIKRKYVPCGLPTTKRRFASDLVGNILKALTKMGGNSHAKQVVNSNSNYNSNNNTNGNNNVSNNNSSCISTAPAYYQYEDSKKSLMSASGNNSASTSIGKSKACIKSQESDSNLHLRGNGKNAISPYSSNRQRDYQVNYLNYSNERALNSQKTKSSFNRNKTTNVMMQHNKCRLSDYNNNDNNKLSKPKSEFTAQKKLKEDNSGLKINSSQSLYPNYIKNSNNCKSKSLSKKHTSHNPNNPLHMLNAQNNKKKIPNLIKIAKRESKEGSLKRNSKASAMKYPNKLTNRKETTRSRSMLEN